MKQLDFYLFRLLAAPLGATMGVALLALLVERMLRVMDLVLDAHGSLGSVLKLLAFLAPHYIGLALPLAFFLAIYVAFNNLHRNNELDALFSGGVSLSRLTRPMLMIAVLVSLLTLTVFNYLQPYGRYAYRAAVHAITYTSQLAYVQEGVFRTYKGTTFIAEQVSSDGQFFRKVFIFSDRDDQPVSLVTAREGHLVSKRDENVLLLRLFDGLRIERKISNGLIQPGQTSSALHFDETRWVIPMQEYLGFRGRGEDEREMTLLELWRGLSSPDTTATKGEIIAELHERFVRSLTIFILPFLAIPLAMGGRRVRQGQGLIVGFVILVIQHELLSLGGDLVEQGLASPWVAQWGSLVLLVTVAATLFYSAAFKVRQSEGRFFDLPSRRRTRRIIIMEAGGRTQ